MVRMALALVVLFFINSHVYADSGWKVEVDGNGKPYVRYNRDDDDKDKPSLDGLYRVLKSRNADLKQQPLGAINFAEYFYDDMTLQRELYAQFKKDCPKALRAALNSAGNMHNPKVLPLRAKFPDALMKTNTIRSVDTIVNKFGYAVEGISHEKFNIRKDSDIPRFGAIVWLSLKHRGE